jgi:hypothetical protein
VTEGKKTIPSESSPIEAVIAPEGQADKHLTSRRRLIKLGGVAAPVALTLTSRPVMAWHCNTTSAWGSAQINPNLSTNARNDKNKIVDNTWTISNWVNNHQGVGPGLPWVELGVRYKIDATTLSSKHHFTKLTVKWLFTKTNFPTPPALNGQGTAKLIDVLNGGDKWSKFMVVARLNAALVLNAATCMKSSTGVDQLSLMAQGSYTPSNLGGVVWDQAMIMEYLEKNYIVLP